MYLDFEDHRPDTPRVPTPISRREGIAWSLAFHLFLVLVYLMLPAGWFAPPETAVVVPPQDPIRYVQMLPLVDRSAPPKLPADQSDIDRRSATIERAPKPDNPDPYSRGDSPEKILGAPEEKAAGPNTPAPPSPSRDQDSITKVLPDNAFLTPRQQAGGGSLGDSLRDLQHYLQDQNFNNQRGGLTEDDPDIQFDSKGIDFGPWLRRFVAQVKSNWFVPEAAMALKGRVVLQFNVQRNGAITELTIAQPSSVDAFTKSAYNALRRTNPTLPLPPDYPAPMASFTVTFHYNEGRNRPQ